MNAAEKRIPLTGIKIPIKGKSISESGVRLREA
jgi:hypothetical protein